MKRNSQMIKIKDIGFHGHHRNHFFEGWYFKTVLSESNITLALIPGISKNPEDPHAFIQVFISPQMIFKYIRFDQSDFSVQDYPFKVSLKDNVFSLETIKFTYHDKDLFLDLSARINGITPIKTSLYSPTIMGPFHYVPRMECNHGVISMNHTLNGTLTLNDSIIHFKNEKGYIEKDWGTSFPSKYVWCQSNHFFNPNTSLFLSIATIPMIGFEFEGLIANITHNNQETRFATYNFSKFKIETIDEHTRLITLTKGPLKCILKITSPSSIALVSPKQGSMKDMIKEGLEGQIHLQLFNGSTLLIDDIGIHSGVEFSGY